MISFDGEAVALISIPEDPPLVSNLINSLENPSQTSKSFFADVTLRRATGSINKVYVNKDEEAVPEQYCPPTVITLKLYVPLVVRVVKEDKVGVPVIVNILGGLPILGWSKLKFEPLDSLRSRANVVPEVNPVTTKLFPFTVEVTTVLEIAALKRDNTFAAVYAVVEEAFTV